MNAAEIACSLGGKRTGGGWIAHCPVPGHGRGRGDCNPSLSLRYAAGRLLVYCHGGCDQGDVVRAIRNRGLWPTERTCSPHTTGHELRDQRRRAAKVAQVAQLAQRSPVLDPWRRAVPAPGTLVERYLQTRRYTGPIPPTIRFVPDLKHPSGTRHPTMVAAVARVPERKVVAIHRTYLAPDGSGKATVDPARMSLGPIGGGAVRLAPAGGHLAVGEGIETTLSIMQATGIPAWAALSAGGIKALILPPLPLASVVTITADHDPTGLKAAHDAAERWTREGRRVRIALPPEGKDFNDLLRGVAA